jgi:hypothetical protein
LTERHDACSDPAQLVQTPGEIMKSIGIVAVIAGLVVGAVSAAHAGSSSTSQVSISGVGGGTVTAHGTLAGARRSADSRQLIGCYLERLSSPTSYIEAHCYARDAGQKSAGCKTRHAHLIELIRMINPTSYIMFDSNEDTGECTKIYVANASNTLPG